MKIVSSASALALVLVISGCTGLPEAASPTAVTASPVIAASTTALPTLLPTAAFSPTPAPPVIVTAVRGNVFIRRGPDLAYNAVAVLMSGQVVKALGRDVLSKWLQIPIPGQRGKTGWVSLQTHYIALDGDIAVLPEIQVTDWPVLASLRNCTQHVMQANPGGIPIPAVAAFPDNEIQINPGIYTIHDMEVDGSPQVMKVEIREGSYVDIRNGGDGDHKKCPMP